ncbi:MAG: metX [Chlorobi bacterium]|nr:metX [Chlorobiota bacterium]
MSDPSHRRVGLARFESPFPLESGAALALAEIAYETYGTPDDEGTNAILVCHALTGSAHAAGRDETGRVGWWDGLIGPGRAIDTDRYFVICSNILGSCYGSTGPASIDPATGVPYGDAFPIVTVRDIVRAQRLLLDHLGIDRLHAVIGGSMGGMQALEWGALFPDDIDLIIPIATSARHSAWCVAFNAIAREALALGERAGDLEAGLRLARKVAMMTYRSGDEFAQRFGRERNSDDLTGVDGTFAVESYLARHGESLARRFDHRAYRAITRGMDLHDLARDRGTIVEVLGAIRHPALCIGISSDILYPPDEQREIARLLPNGEYREIQSLCGHDAFLIEYEQLNRLVRRFLAGHEPAAPTGASPIQTTSSAASGSFPHTYTHIRTGEHI